MPKWNKKNPRFKRPSLTQRKKKKDRGIFNAVASWFGRFIKPRSSAPGRKIKNSLLKKENSSSRPASTGKKVLPDEALSIPRPSPKDSRALKQSSVLKQPSRDFETARNNLEVKVADVLYEEYTSVVIDDEILETPHYLRQNDADTLFKGMDDGVKTPEGPDISQILTIQEPPLSSGEFLAVQVPEATAVVDLTEEDPAIKQAAPAVESAIPADKYFQQDHEDAVHQLSSADSNIRQEAGSLQAGKPSNKKAQPQNASGQAFPANIPAPKSADHKSRQVYNKQPKKTQSYTVVEKALVKDSAPAQKKAQLPQKQVKQKKHPRQSESGFFKRRPPLWRAAAVAAFGLLLIAFTALQLPNLLPRYLGEAELLIDESSGKELLLPELLPGPFESYAALRQKQSISEVTVKKGHTLGKALEEMELGSQVNRTALLKCLTEDVGIKTLHTGSILRAYWKDDARNSLSHIEYQRNAKDRPLVVRPNHNDDGFWFYNLSAPPIKVTAAKEGVVTSSLWEAGIDAGLDPNLIVGFADIMASVIDFVTDIKQGDTFQILYTREYVDGKAQGQANIEMVRMTTNKNNYEFYYYIDSKGKVGYYDDKGKSSKKTFFVSPLQYKRISSGYNLRRRHPIFKTIRPHQGVDYAAPSGTPVSTVADGVVLFADWNGGYGRLVTVKHNATYTTMYAHLSRFAKGIKKGAKVSQGDVIGYVGATGTATGPHLDFRIKQNGSFVDPIPTLAKQEGKELDPADKQAFTIILTQTRNRMAAYLNANRQQ